MNRNELLTGDQNILSRTKYFCPGQNFFCPRQNFFVPDKTFFVHAEGRGISFQQLLSILERALRALASSSGGAACPGHSVILALTNDFLFLCFFGVGVAALVSLAIFTAL